MRLNSDTQRFLTNGLCTAFLCSTMKTYFETSASFLRGDVHGSLINRRVKETKLLTEL